MNTLLPDKSPNAISTAPAPNNALAEGLSTELEIGLNLPAEILGENSEVAADSSSNTSVKVASQSTGATNNDEYVAKLKASQPPKQQMIAEISNVISSELKTFRSSEKQLAKEGVKKAKEYSEIIAKIRELTKILENIAIATYDQLKAIWLRIVHKIV